jgi:stage IV sporulation protein FB
VVPHLITIAAGPAVNVVFAVLIAPALHYLGVPLESLLNPFAGARVLHSVGDWWPLAAVFVVNYWLFVFNVFLPIYPLDGGQLLFGFLWLRMSQPKALLRTVTIGMVLSVMLAVLALSTGQPILFLICLLSFAQCWYLRSQLERFGTGMTEENEFGYDFSQGYTSLERSMPKVKEAKPAKKRRTWGQWWAERQAKKRAAETAQNEAEVDRILDKINREGMQSLTEREKRILRDASERNRRKMG